MDDSNDGGDEARLLNQVFGGFRQLADPSASSRNVVAPRSPDSLDRFEHKEIKRNFNEMVDEGENKYNGGEIEDSYVSDEDEVDDECDNNQNGIHEALDLSEVLDVRVRPDEKEEKKQQQQQRQRDFEGSDNVSEEEGEEEEEWCFICKVERTNPRVVDMYEFMEREFGPISYKEWLRRIKTFYDTKIRDEMTDRREWTMSSIKHHFEKDEHRPKVVDKDIRKTLCQIMNHTKGELVVVDPETRERKLNDKAYKRYITTVKLYKSLYSA
jgi:hypothetical protein